MYFVQYDPRLIQQNIGYRKVRICVRHDTYLLLPEERGQRFM